MSKQKDKWYETYRISTSLNPEEVKERIESKTAVGSLISLKGYLFYGKEIDSENINYTSHIAK